MRLRGLVGSVLLMATGACVTPSASVLAQDLPLVRMRPDSAAYTLSSTYEEAQQLIVRDEATWRDAWQRVYGRSRPVPPPPELDFEREMVAIAALGRQTSGGHAIRLERAYREGPAIVMVVRREQPAQGCIVPSALTWPVDLATLPASPDPVTFRFEDVTRDCTRR